MPLDNLLDRITPKFIESALGDDTKASEILGKVVLAIAEIEVEMNLRRRPLVRGRGLCMEFVQDTMTYLYERDGWYLRRWEPGRGLFKTYVCVIASGVVSRKIRQFRGNPIAVTPMEDEAIELCLSGQGGSIEQEVVHRLELWAIWEWVQETSDLDRARFSAMFIDAKTAAAIAAEEDSSAEAVHTWCSRFRKRIAKARPEASNALCEIVRRRRSQRN